MSRIGNYSRDCHKCALKYVVFNNNDCLRADTTDMKFTAVHFIDSFIVGRMMDFM